MQNPTTSWSSREATSNRPAASSYNFREQQAICTMGSSLVLACIAAVLSLSSGVDAITRADCDKMSSDTLKQKCFQLVARSSGGSDSESSGGSGGGVTGSFSHDGGTTLAGSGGSYTMGSGGGGAGGGTESGGGLLSGTGSGSFGRSGSGSGSKGACLALLGSACICGLRRAVHCLFCSRPAFWH